LSVTLAEDEKLILETGKTLEKVKAGYEADQSEKTIVALHDVGAELIRKEYLEALGTTGRVYSDIIDYDLLQKAADLICSFLLDNIEEISDNIAREDRFWKYRTNHMLVFKEWAYFLTHLVTKPLGTRIGFRDPFGVYLLNKLKSDFDSGGKRWSKLSIDEFVELDYYYGADWALWNRTGFRDVESDFTLDANRKLCLRLFEQLYGPIPEQLSVIPYSWFTYPSVQGIVDKFYAELRDTLTPEEEEDEDE